MHKLTLTTEQLALINRCLHRCAQEAEKVVAAGRAAAEELKAMQAFGDAVNEQLTQQQGE